MDKTYLVCYLEESIAPLTFASFQNKEIWFGVEEQVTAFKIQKQINYKRPETITIISLTQIS